MRWWRLALGGALLTWVLATAYRRARSRGRRVGPALLLVAAAALMFAASAFAPRPPMTVALATVLVVGCIAALAGAMAIVLWRGFRDRA
ncbi:MAG: hypothetical protein ACE149_03030 [Armatimonadota bacterium]